MIKNRLYADGLCSFYISHIKIIINNLQIPKSLLILTFFLRHKNVYEKDMLSCITHTNDFKVYESEEGDLLAEFERDNITEIIKRKSPANCNLIDAHSTSDGGILLLTGSNLNKG